MRSIIIPSSKGNIGLNILLFIVLLFVIGLAFILSQDVFTDINNDIQNDIGISQVAKDSADNTVSQVPSWADNAFVFFLVAFWIMLIATSFLIDTNPIFFFISVFLLVITLVVGMILSNAYSEITTEPDVQSFTDLFPKIDYVMNHLLIIMIVIGFTGMLALYARNSG